MRPCLGSWMHRNASFTEEQIIWLILGNFSFVMLKIIILHYQWSFIVMFQNFSRSFPGLLVHDTVHFHRRYWECVVLHLLQMHHVVNCCFRTCSPKTCSSYHMFLFLWSKRQHHPTHNCWHGRWSVELCQHHLWCSSHGTKETNDSPF